MVTPHKDRLTALHNLCAVLPDELGAAVTNKKEFPDKFESIIPWENFIEIIQPSIFSILRREFAG